LKKSAESDPQRLIRHRAMDLLARREHSAHELQAKLVEKFPEHASLVEPVLAGLARDNLQSDQRFAESYVCALIHRGQGPYRIRQALQQRGVDTSLAEQTIAVCDEDWFELAVQVMHKKYGRQPCTSFAERARRSRFLQYRGFSVEQIQACFTDNETDDG
jgi:regulatory protein|tara:strand:- start:7030 stop:7509 length:480 start_codon:yes stop_codon:yes gene_type:complete